MKSFTLAFILLSAAFARAITTGQYEVRVYNGSGFDSSYLTLTDGQVIGKSSGSPTAITLNAAAVGLGSVENIALSTWSGTTSVATLGTITTGTWNATPLGLAYIAQGGATSGQALTWNGSAWAPTTIVRLDTAQAFTQPQTVSVAGGTTGELIGANVGGVSRFSVDAEGGVTCGYYSSFGVGSSTSLTLKGQYGTLSISSGGSAFFMSGDVRMYSLSVSDGAVLHSARLTYSPTTDGCLELHNYTTPQIFRVYKSFGSAGHYGSTSHYERLALQSGSDYVEVAAETLGDGADDINVRITPAGAGGVVIGSGGTPHNKVKSGVATLAAGTVTVSDSDVLETGTAATSSRILVTRMTDGGTVGTYSITRTNATSFTVTSTSSGDTSTVSWLMINP